MKKRRLIWQIFPTYLLITILSLLVIGWYASRVLKDLYFHDISTHLTVQAQVIRHQIKISLLDDDLDRIKTLCKILGPEINTRVTVILPGGEVLGDSDENPEHMDNHGDRPEIREALAGRPGLNTRYSYTLSKEMLYAAVPVYSSNEVIAVVRVAIPLTAIDTVLKSVYSRIAMAGIIIVVIASGLSWWVSRRITRPLAELTEGARRFAKGDFKRRLPIPNSEEIGELAASMNQMSIELDSRIQSLVRQENQEAAILSSMIEGVLAVDPYERIILMNFAAGRMFDVQAAQVEGKNLPEAVRNIDLLEFVSATLTEGRSNEDSLFLDGGRTVLQARGTILKDADGNRIGAMVVLHDVTRIRQLEELRREFAANVSHELRTPITSIKGFVETLLQGALDNREEAERFLKVVAKHTDRLNAIIEDLLALSRIEQDEVRTDMVLEIKDIPPILEAAIESCQVSASQKNIRLLLQCCDVCPARINVPLIEQAVVNLIDNAIKYSPEGSQVEIEGVCTEEEIDIRVTDHGCGIPEGHLPRIFERFYRVDQARSRDLGGTGLGLAIVKHIALAHGGRISVKSTPGEGSVFLLSLPLA